ncbi:hypothetical protein [Pyxidicoccus xibeiensis]|uniref:hypothetical protein n=1 Tax=Pyxidicoccus xibeiensis TaxID=2906759 RepID=UPI0020A81E9A|nr:hypothetical protein [Pyxidicoccus xibeiensis]MCP3143812.1 hypothetical protein [Pyxidicoccus xibeiensis]
MSFRRLARVLGAATLLAAFRLAHADPSPVALPTVQRAFEHGRFAEVLRDAEQALTQAPPAEQPVLHQLAALSAFNLGEHDRSDSHFRALLRLVPDHALDPYSIPPPALRRFEQLRMVMEPELLAIRRQEQALREAELALERERERGAEVERQQARELEAQRQRTAEATRAASAYRPLVAWLPFGAGQFQQGRKTAGTVLAVAEGALALGSITSFITYHALLDRRTIQVERADGPHVITERGIQPAFQERMRGWRTVNLITTVGFFGLWLAGAAEAHLREPEAPGPSSSPTPTPTLSIGAGGASVGLGLRF